MAEHHLPQQEADYLASLLSNRAMPALRRRTLLLREQGWTLRAIGAPLSTARSTVRSWENHPDAQIHSEPRPGGVFSSPAPPPLPSPPRLRPIPTSPTSPTSPSPTPLRVRALAPDVPLADQLRIKQLAPLARRVRGGTPPSSQFRLAKTELDALLLRYHTRGVPTQRLAQLAGVTYRAMRVRLSPLKEVS